MKDHRSFSRWFLKFIVAWACLISMAMAGDVKVTLSPSGVVTAGAMWRLDGGAWQNSDATLRRVSQGSHTISYAPVPGWTAPASETISVPKKGVVTLFRAYSIPTGRLTIDATPAPAKTLGAARFRVDNGPWIACGGPELALAIGTHEIEFEDTPHWIEPAPRTVTVAENTTTALTVAYGYRHRLRFFLDPALAADLSETQVRERIAQYVVHLQSIFDRESSRRLVFDPATDISYTTTSPFSNVYTGTVPQLGYEVWVHAQLSQNIAYGTYGGYGAIDQSGAGGAAGLYWDKIHDPAQIVDGSSDAMQYWRQIDHIIHELEHTFGAGVGEYYSAANVKDLTGVEPVLPAIPYVNVSATYPFWEEQTDYFGDPLMANAWANPRVGSPTSIAALLEATRFAPATVGALDGLYRSTNLLNSIPDLSAVNVRVVDAAGNLIPAATVRVWNRPTPSGTTPPAEIPASPGSAPGSFHFSWTPYPHISVFGNYSNMKLIKAYAPGYTPRARWVWIYTAQAEKTLLGATSFTVTLVLDAE